MPKSKLFSDNSPKKPSNFVTLSVYFPIEYLEPLRRFAYEDNISRSALIVEVLGKYIFKRDGKYIEGDDSEPEY